MKYKRTLRRRLRHMVDDLRRKIYGLPPAPKENNLTVIGYIRPNHLQTFPQKMESQKEVRENDD